MATIYRVDGREITPGRGWTDGSGTQHPAQWGLWSPDEMRAAGITKIVMQPLPDQRFYLASNNPDGTVNKKDKDLSEVKEYFLNEIKRQQKSFLNLSDWAVVRKAEIDKAIPSNIATWRAAIRTKGDEMKTAVAGAANVAAVEALLVTYDEDGKKSGVLFDWPVLVE